MSQDPKATELRLIKIKSQTTKRKPHLKKEPTYIHWITNHAMFKQLKKQYAKEISKQVEKISLDVLNQVNPQKKTEEQTTENLGQLSGRRKALFIGINYVGQQGELK